MCGAEGIHHEHVAERGVLLRGIVEVLLLALIDAAVLQHHQFTRGDIEAAVDPILDQAHGLAQAIGNVVGDGLQGILRGPFTFGRTTQMRCHHHLGALLEAMIDGCHRGGDARIGRDLAVLHGHVQVGADQNTFTFQIEIGQFDNGHIANSKILLPRLASSK